MAPQPAPPSQRRTGLLWQFGIAVGSVCVVTLAKLLLHPFIGKESPFLMYPAAVAVCAVLGGWRSGVMAVAAAAAASDYFFLEPRFKFSLGPEALSQIIRLTQFTLECLLVTTFCGMLHVARARAEDSAAAAALARAAAERERRAAKRAQAQAERSRDTAEEANRCKDQFLATVSHELRTPLNAILGWSMILRRRGAEPQDLEEGLAVIERNAHAQAHLIEDLLDVARITSGKIRLACRPTELAPIVAEAVESLRPAVEAKGIRVEQEVQSDAGSILGDRDRLQQVVWNLLTNAVKFSPEGGTIRVSLRRCNSKVRIVVTDQGRGIAPDFLPHVFERFRQADGSPTRAKPGLGLGLSICRHIVELHGGEIAAASPGEGRGATFTVTLPTRSIQCEAHRAALTPSGDKSARPDSEAEAPSALLRGLQVLVVDDEADSRRMAVKILSQCGADARAAGSVAEALRELSRWTPDVVISDIAMPGEDGYDLTVSGS